MLIRPMVGGAVTVGLIYFARTPTDLLVRRLLQGATAGTVAAATALVAAETPRNRVGWALGVVTSAVALGSAVGPVVGGRAAAVLGLWPMFLFGGALLLLWTMPGLFFVRAGPLPRRPGPQGGCSGLINAAPGPPVVVAGVALNGLVSGVVIPATASMIGLETPPEAQSTVFGANASSVALGFAIGPAIGGAVAATASVSAALIVVAGLALALAAIVAAGRPRTGRRCPCSLSL